MVFFRTSAAPRPGRPYSAMPMEGGTGPTAGDGAASAAQSDAVRTE